MKNVKFSVISTAILLLLAVSCSQNEKINDTQIEHKKFLTNVAIVETNSVVVARGDNSKVALTIELFSPDKNYPLGSAVNINDIEYCDNGLFNDLVAGDRVYTSVKTFTSSQPSSEFDLRISRANEFKYSDQLVQTLKKRYPKDARTKSIGVSCEVSLVTCPETSWYNSCWPLSSPCTCVHIGPCSIEVSIF